MNLVYCKLIYKGFTSSLQDKKKIYEDVCLNILNIKIMNTQNTLRFFLKSISITTLLLLVISCNQSGSNFKESVSVTEADINYAYEAVEAEETISQDDAVKKVNSNLQDLKIIKTANVRFKVKDIQESAKQIKMFVDKTQGYISDMRFNNSLYRKENNFTIKVPKAYFDSLIDSVSQVAEFIEHIEVTSKDVTEEYMDVETRLKTKLEVKERYEEILRKNAKTVKDILETEEKLRIIQEEIEVAQGKLNYMSNRVSFSTLNVSLYETVEHKDQPEVYKRTFGSKIIEALSFGWDLIKNLFLGILFIWPLILIAMALIFMIIKRRRNKK